MSRLDNYMNYLWTKLRKSKNDTVTLTKEELKTLTQEIKYVKTNKKENSRIKGKSTY